jgi:hypothetical protein
MHLIDVVQRLNVELRFNAAFRKLLRDIDQAAEKRIAASYIDWLYHMLDAEKGPPNEPR